MESLDPKGVFRNNGGCQERHLGRNLEKQGRYIASTVHYLVSSKEAGRQLEREPLGLEQYQLIRDLRNFTFQEARISLAYSAQQFVLLGNCSQQKSEHGN